MESQNNRNYGIDLFRILSMNMIIILHVLYQGGILNKCVSVNYKIGWFLEIGAYCAVNCYALISGYVGYDAKFKYSNIIWLYLQVAFYSITIAIVFSVFTSLPIDAEDSKKIVFPLTSNSYWYFTSYFCMFFFIPFMNKLIKELEAKQIKILLGTIIVIFSIVPVICQKELFYTGLGYSALWLGILYIVGACVKKYNIEKRLSNIKCLGAYVVCITYTWLLKLKVESVSQKYFNKPYENPVLISYISPAILFAGIFMLLLFAKLECKGFATKLISFFAPLSFSVYLIHAHPLVWKYIVIGRFSKYASYHPAMLVFSVLATVFIIWLLCSLVDLPRHLLFTRIRKKRNIR